MSPIGIYALVAVLVLAVVMVTARWQWRRRHRVEFAGALRTLGEARTRKPTHIQAQADDRAGTGRGVTVVDHRE